MIPLNKLNRLFLGKKGQEWTMYETVELVLLMMIIVMMFLSVRSLFFTEKLSNKLNSFEIAGAIRIAENIPGELQVDYTASNPITIQIFKDNTFNYIYVYGSKEERKELTKIPNILDETLLKDRMQLTIQKDSTGVKVV